MGISLKSYNQKVKNYRSFFIEEVASLEVQMEWIFSSYFSRNEIEYALFNQIFFSSSTTGFKQKIKMFETFIENIIPDFKDRYPNTIKQLKKIQEIRNRFAHMDILNPHSRYHKKFNNTIFFFTVERGEQKTVTYTIDELNEASKWTSKLNNILADMIREFKNNNQIHQNFEKL